MWSHSTSGQVFADGSCTISLDSILPAGYRISQAYAQLSNATTIVISSCSISGDRGIRMNCRKTSDGTAYAGSSAGTINLMLTLTAM